MHARDVVSKMDREYLTDYDQREREEFERLVRKKAREGKFRLGMDKYPPDERFVNLKTPVSLVGPLGTELPNLFAQIPFSGSTILFLPIMPKRKFERTHFKVTEIPKVIDFIKDTGRLQVALLSSAVDYEGIDYLEPFFDNLKPPTHYSTPLFIFGNQIEIKRLSSTFLTLARVRFTDYVRGIFLPESDSHGFSITFQKCMGTYVILGLANYPVVDDIENLLIDDPESAYDVLQACKLFITEPLIDLRGDMINFSLSVAKLSGILPSFYRPKPIRFPFEIGRFLVKKLTYAAQDVRACYELMDHYDSYDLRKVQESLNKAIVSNCPDIVNTRAEELSEILQNAWDDQTIPKRIKNLKIGMPISIAAIGAVAGGLLGGIQGMGAGGFLSELGYKVVEKSIDKFVALKGENLSEKLAKLRTRSFQANIYDFKKKYKSQIRTG